MFIQFTWNIKVIKQSRAHASRAHEIFLNFFFSCRFISRLLFDLWSKPKKKRAFKSFNTNDYAFMSCFSTLFYDQISSVVEFHSFAWNNFSTSYLVFFNSFHLSIMKFMNLFLAFKVAESWIFFCIRNLHL